MPTADSYRSKRGGPLTVVFWIGVALAPLAALLILVSQGAGALRVAAILAVVAVVCIGLSLVLRKDAETMRVELEEVMLDEIDSLRDDVRADIATATRSSHRQLAERLQALQQSLENLRGQLDAMRGVIPAVPHPQGRSGQGGQRGSGNPGVVRHTETVQVTTRQTIVDPRDDQSGTVYGAPSRRGAGDRHFGREGQPEPRRPTPAGYTADDGYARSGDRWASVRADDRGRELVMGERRRAVRRDGSGTEMHIEDRWAAVRRDDPRDRFDADEDGDSGFWSDNWDAEPDEERRNKTRRRALPSSPSQPEERWSSHQARDSRDSRTRRSRDGDGYERR
jgi:hypothetical protein